MLFYSMQGSECKRTFCSYAAFKTHFYRAHNVPAPFATATAVVSNFKCAILLCERQFHAVKELTSHLKEHLAEGRPVACPVMGCQKTFTVKSSFTAHMSRKHRECSVNSISDMYREIISQPPVTAYEDASHSLASANESSEIPKNFSESFLRNGCLFYLKLQGQLLLPVLTIQTIVKAMQNVLKLGQDYTLSRLHSLLKNYMSLTDDIAKISSCVKDSDLFSVGHKGP